MRGTIIRASPFEASIVSVEAKMSVDPKGHALSFFGKHRDYGLLIASAYRGEKLFYNALTGFPRGCVSSAGVA